MACRYWLPNAPSLRIAAARAIGATLAIRTRPLARSTHLALETKVVIDHQPNLMIACRELTEAADTNGRSHKTGFCDTLLRHVLRGL